MIIADTGFFLALANRKDRHHARAKQALARVKEPLVTTWPVVTETCHLLATRLGATPLFAFVESAMRGAFEIFEIAPQKLPAVLALMRKYRSLPMDWADASLVLLAEELGSGKILSTDRRDFETYRWKERKPFENLLELD